MWILFAVEFLHAASIVNGGYDNIDVVGGKDSNNSYKRGTEACCSWLCRLLQQLGKLPWNLVRSELMIPNPPIIVQELVG
jgi:hypothetical protein